MTRGKKNPLWFGLAERLSKARATANQSGRQVSVAAGLGPHVCSWLESSAHEPAIDTVERIACAVGVPPGWLAFGDEGLHEFKERRPRSPIPPDPPELVSGGLPFQSLHLGAGERLRSRREALGLSLRALATAAGLSFETIRKWETGAAVPKVGTCERLAVALDVAPRWLAFGADDADS